MTEMCLFAFNVFDYSLHVAALLLLSNLIVIDTNFSYEDGKRAVSVDKTV